MRTNAELAGGWRPPDLTGRVACVTGASYGIGRGIAEVLGQCGATVYVTARSTRGDATRTEGWTVDETAELVDAAGGEGIALGVDHTREQAVLALFERIDRDHGGLDILVNNVWQWGSLDTYFSPTVEQPIARWDAMFGVGVRSHLLAVTKALPLMDGRAGLIVSTQERPGNTDRFADNVVVDTAAIAMERMIRFLAHELRDTRIAPILVYPGWVRTVNMGMGFDPHAHGWSDEQFIEATQSPALIGRAIAELAADPDAASKAGGTFFCGDLAREFGFTDTDGRVPDDAEG